MDRPKAYLCLVWLVGVVSAQTGQQGLTRPTPAVSVTPATNRAQLEPVILTRASLDEKVITLRLAPRVATSIRMPEPVNSVVVGDPENFQAEHSEHEPELVTVKPVAPQPAQTNLLITTTLGHQANLLLISFGEQKRAPLPVLYGQHPGEIEAGPRIRAGVSEVLDEGNEVVVLFSAVNPSSHAIEILPPQVQLGGKAKKKWTTAEQLRVIDFRLSTRRLGAGQRTDGVVIFERPNFKQSSETLFLQVADSGAVDLPALAPIGFGISSFRGGSAYEVR